jgi:hypothetical protein
MFNVPSFARRPQEAEGQQPDERGAAPEVVSILPVERAGVAESVLRGRITLLPAGATAALAAPVHGLAVAREAEAVAEKPAAKHRESAYPGGAR